MTTTHSPIRYIEFLSRVERGAGRSRPEAERAVRATLGERLSRGGVPIAPRAGFR
jgi:hypothetical protein